MGLSIAAVLVWRSAVGKLPVYIVAKLLKTVTL